VIAMLSIGAGAERESLRLIDTMGLRNVIVRDRELNDEDLKRIRENSLGLSLRDVKAISAVTPDIDAYSARKRIKTYQIFSFQGKSDDSNVVGVTPSYFRLARYDLSEGSFFAESDNRDYEQYCVVGERARQKLFGYRSPLGQQIRVDDLWFTVIGVLEDRSLTKDEFEGVKLQDYSNDIYIPLETALKKFELKKFEPELDEIVIQMKNTEALRASAVLISQILVNAHGHENDFSMIVPSELLDQNERTQRIFDVVMSCIAGISLLVGGIGIMNIMLANILERTREIGVRRAVGARRRDIRKQFLTEALAISLLGGLTGILFGFAVSRMVALYA
ncbi:MAG: ABC transporter permease, partial [Blastocatellia bacterium]